MPGPCRLVSRPPRSPQEVLGYFRLAQSGLSYAYLLWFCRCRGILSPKDGSLILPGLRQKQNGSADCERPNGPQAFESSTLSRSGRCKAFVLVKMPLHFGPFSDRILPGFRVNALKVRPHSQSVIEDVNFRLPCRRALRDRRRSPIHSTCPSMDRTRTMIATLDGTSGAVSVPNPNQSFLAAVMVGLFALRPMRCTDRSFE